MTRNDPLADAERLAPLPATRDAATRDAWIRHYAAVSLAAWTVFDREAGHLPPHPAEGSRPDLGYLAALGVASTHAAVALAEPGDTVPDLLWDLTPEVGALNGEWEEWLVDTLDRLGVNPADINPEYNASDFRGPTTAEAAVA